jgi:glycosyltransferase involved in cell wall biosynthesis
VKLDRASGIKKLIKRILVGFVIRSLWGVMPFGSAGTEYFLNYGARKDRVYRFPAEPDYAVIERTTTADVETAAARFGLRPGRRRIVFCGRLIEVKRLDTLLDAFNSIADKRPEWDLVVIGDGPLKDHLKARVRADLASRVIWTGFLADAQTISAIYRGSDALVLPSQFDQWALVVNEALAAGLAIITSDVVGSADDLLHPGENGFTFPVGDAARLAEVLLDVTSAEKIEQYKAGSVRVISEWRRTSDPIDGLRRALRDSGVVPAPAGITPRP